MLMKEIIDQIDDVILESEIDVLQAMSDVYDKAQIILENSDTTDGLVSSYAFFQEGEIMDQATGKGKDESAIKKIAAFLPRLIMAIVDFIKKKFTKKEEAPLVKYTKDSFEKLVKEIKEKGTDSPLVKGLIAAGAATVTIGAGGAIIVKMRRHDGEENNDESVDDEIIINPPDEAEQPEQPESPEKPETSSSESTPQSEEQESPEKPETSSSESTPQSEEPKQPETPKQQEKTQNASIQIVRPQWAEYIKLFTEFNNSLRDKSQDIEKNENGIKQAFADLHKGWDQLKQTKKRYNSKEEEVKVKNDFHKTLDETGEILKIYAKKITETTMQANGDNNKIVHLNNTFRVPLNYLLNKLKWLDGSGSAEFDHVMGQLNLTFAKLMQQGNGENNSPKSDNTTGSQVQSGPAQEQES